MSAQHTQGPTLIQRQDALVAQLQPIHKKFIKLGNSAGGAYAGERARFKNQHITELRAAGYSQREAADSAQQCDDVARLNADCDVLAEQLGAKASSEATPPISPIDDQAACIAADIAIARERNSIDYISARERHSLTQERQELAGITSNTGLWSAQRR